MKLILHLEGPKYGTLCFEVESHFRILHSADNYELRTGKTIIESIRVPLPPLLVTIQYRKTTHGNFVYEGQPGSALHIYFLKKPLTSIEDLVYNSPTDPGGLVCTPHTHDNSCHKDLPTLASFVLKLWFDCAQRLYDKKISWAAWQKKDLSNVHTLVAQETQEHRIYGGNKGNLPATVESILKTAVRNHTYKNKAEVIDVHDCEVPELIDAVWPPPSIENSIKDIQAAVKKIAIEKLFR